MSDKAELLDQLKIDRDFDAGSSQSWLWPLLFVGLLLVGGLVWVFSRESAPLVELVSVSSAQTQTAASQTVLDASGYVVARRQATVSAEITGRVQDVLIEEGMQVEAGQVLARLDAASAQAQSALAQAQVAAAKAAREELNILYEEAQRKAKRARRLYKEGVFSEAQRDAAVAEERSLHARAQRLESEYQVALSNLELQQEFLADHVIRAPFTGVVTVKAAQSGEMISPVSAGGGFTRTGVATVVDMASLEIEVDVNENFINRVQASQAVTARLNAYPDWRIPARVIAVVPAADRNKATVKVRIALEESDQRVLPDMGVRVAFLGDESVRKAAVATLPAKAVFDDAGRSVVFVHRDGKLERRAVSVAQRVGDTVLLQAGIAVGEQVALQFDGIQFVDGMAVATQ